MAVFAAARALGLPFGGGSATASTWDFSKDLNGAQDRVSATRQAMDMDDNSSDDEVTIVDCRPAPQRKPASHHDARQMTTPPGLQSGTRTAGQRSSIVGARKRPSPEHHIKTEDVGSDEKRRRVGSVNASTPLIGRPPSYSKTTNVTEPRVPFIETEKTTPSNHTPAAMVSAPSARFGPTSLSIANIRGSIHDPFMLDDESDDDGDMHGTPARSVPQRSSLLEPSAQASQKLTQSLRLEQLEESRRLREAAVAKKQGRRSYGEISGRATLSNSSPIQAAPNSRMVSRGLVANPNLRPSTPRTDALREPTTFLASNLEGLQPAKPSSIKTSPQAPIRSSSSVKPEVEGITTTHPTVISLTDITSESSATSTVTAPVDIQIRNALTSIIKHDARQPARHSNASNQALQAVKVIRANFVDASKTSTVPQQSSREPTAAKTYNNRNDDMLAQMQSHREQAQKLERERAEKAAKEKREVRKAEALHQKTLHEQREKQRKAREAADATREAEDRRRRQKQRDQEAKVYEEQQRWNEQQRAQRQQAADAAKRAHEAKQAQDSALSILLKSASKPMSPAANQAAVTPSFATPTTSPDESKQITDGQAKPSADTTAAPANVSDEERLRRIAEHEARRKRRLEAERAAEAESDAQPDILVVEGQDDITKVDEKSYVPISRQAQRAAHETPTSAPGPGPVSLNSVAGQERLARSVVRGPARIVSPSLLHPPTKSKTAGPRKQFDRITAGDVWLVKKQASGMPFDQLSYLSGKVYSQKRSSKWLADRFVQLQSIVATAGLSLSVLGRVEEDEDDAIERLNEKLLSTDTGSEAGHSAWERPPDARGHFIAEPKARLPIGNAPSEAVPTPTIELRRTADDAFKAAHDLDIEDHGRRPRTGSKTVNVQSESYYAQIALERHREELQALEEQYHRRSPSPFTQSDYVHYCYQVQRREISEDEMGASYGIEDREWIFCEGEWTDLAEANLECAREATRLLNAPRAICDMTLGNTIQNEYDADQLQTTTVTICGLGIIQARVTGYLRTYHEGVLPVHKDNWNPKTLFFVKERLVKMEGDGVFDGMRETDVTIVTDNKFFSVLEQANEHAIKTFVGRTFRSQTRNLVQRDAEMRELEEMLGYEFDIQSEEFCKLHEFEGQGKTLEVWVEEGELCGPRN